MSRRKEIATLGMNKALRLRAKLSVDILKPISVFDEVQRLGIDVWFVMNPTMEGMYYNNDRSHILINSERPVGRQAFTCAHELGHHIFNHGTQIDEIDEIGFKTKEEEYLVDIFAGTLLMPGIAISKAINDRKLTVSTLTPIELYKIACYFKVGYETLISHMTYHCHLISEELATKFLKTKPKEIKQGILNHKLNSNLIYIDQFWGHSSIDCSTNDILLLPKSTYVNKDLLEKYDSIPEGELYLATKVGAQKYFDQQLNLEGYIRVMKKNFTGLAEYRFLEDSDDE